MAELLRETLKRDGLAIATEVLSLPECQALHAGLWAGLTHVTQDWVTPVRREDRASWRGIYQLQPAHGMLLQHWELGHVQAAWDVRQHPAVCDIFAQLWGVAPDELLCSMDGIAVSAPPEVTGRGWHTGVNKLHCDQSFRVPGLETYQGWVNALPTAEGDATLTYLHGSHAYHTAAAERFPGLCEGGHWHQLTDEMIRFYTEECGCPQQEVTCPAGALVLWDSRTIHSGRAPLRSRPAPHERAVVYVCMAPRARATPAAVRKHVQAFRERRLTGHHPTAPRLFPRLPRSYGRVLPTVTPVPEPMLTPLGRALVGL